MFKKMEKVGKIAFLVGVALAIVLGVIGQASALWVGILAILGLAVGFLNVTHKESTSFLVAVVALLLAVGNGTISAQISSLWINLGMMLSNIVAFVAPAALIVALRGIYETAGTK
tara:strand:- start:1358 stop:1702 length:345 start_codon:yes stop_codon:yes gene_type:complete